jgi:rhodanese-related sulfurtransferase/thioredoxin-related protein
MAGITRKINLLANVLLVIAGLAVSGVAVRHYLRNIPARDTPSLATGSKVQLADVNWAENGQTLLLVLDISCRYCTESAPFYQALAEEAAQSRAVHLVAAFQQEAKYGRDYLRGLGVNIEHVRQAKLSTLGVRGTPMLILLDGSGSVMRKWVGKLAKWQELEVIAYVRGRQKIEDTAQTMAGDTLATAAAAMPSPPGDAPTAREEPTVFDSVTLRQQLDSKRPIILLDVDEREDFARGHIESAKNIPLDEIFVRCLDELPQSDQIVVYTRQEGDSRVRMAINQLSVSGYRRVGILRGGMSEWQQAGLPLVGGRQP